MRAHASPALAPVADLMASCILASAAEKGVCAIAMGSGVCADSSALEAAGGSAAGLHAATRRAEQPASRTDERVKVRLNIGCLRRGAAPANRPAAS